jgi:outer membrane protein TolC
MRFHRAGTRRAAGIVVLAGALAGCQSYEASELDARAHRRVWSDRTPTSPEVLDAAARLDDGTDAAPFSLDDGLSLREAEAVALVYNPDLREARARAGVSAASAAHAGIVPDPVLSGDIARIIDDVDNRWMGAAVLGFTIPVSGRLEAERELAGADHEADVLRVYAQEWRTRLALREAWTEWSIASRKVEVLDLFLGELSSLVRTVDAIEEAGEIAPVDARLFTLERASRVAQRATAIGEVERSRARILRLLGLDQRRSIEMVPGVVSVQVDSAQEFDGWASIEHPDALVARAEHDAADRRFALEIRKQYPDIVIGPGFGHEDGNDRVILGFSAPIPLFNRNRQGVEVARAEREAARVGYEATLERLEADLGEARVGLIAARATREVLEREVTPIADRQHDEAIRIAELGEVDTLLLLESLKRRFDTRLGVLEAQRLESLASIGVRGAIGPERPQAAMEVTNP